MLISVDYTILTYWVQHSETIDNVAEISAVPHSEPIFLDSFEPTYWFHPNVIDSTTSNIPELLPSNARKLSSSRNTRDTTPALTYASSTTSRNTPDPNIEDSSMLRHIEEQQVLFPTSPHSFSATIEEQTNIWIENYWTKFHPSFPLFHRATFNNAKEPTLPILLAAMVVIGMQYSKDHAIKRKARILFDRILKLREMVKPSKTKIKHGYLTIATENCAIGMGIR